MSFLIKRKLRSSLNFLRLRPDTFIVGFQKCGTTSLYQYLIESEAYASGMVKENDLLTSEGLYLKEYLAGFPLAFREKKKRTLCASHQVAFNPIGIQRLKEHFPLGKFVFIMRDPVQRAYSRFVHNQSKVGAVTDIKFDGDFLSMVKMELELLERVDSIYDVDEVYELTSKITPYGLPISRGIYYSYVKRFLDNGMECHFMSLEDLSNDFSNEMQRLYQFLGITGPIPLKTIYNKGQPKYIDFSVSSAMSLLRDFYREPNRKLYDLIKKDFKW